MKRLIAYSITALLLLGGLFIIFGCKSKDDDKRMIGEWNKQETFVEIQLFDTLRDKSSEILQASTQEDIGRFNQFVAAFFQQQLDNFFLGFTCNTIDRLSMRLQIPQVGEKVLTGSYFYQKDKPLLIELEPQPFNNVEAAPLIGLYGGMGAGSYFNCLFSGEDDLEMTHQSDMMIYAIKNAFEKEDLIKLVARTLNHLNADDQLTDEQIASAKALIGLYLLNLKSVRAGYKLKRK